MTTPPDVVPDAVIYAAVVVLAVLVTRCSLP
jgi:hypothetical protein